MQKDRMHTDEEISRMGPDAEWQLSDCSLLLAEIENKQRAARARLQITDEDRKMLAKINRHEYLVSQKRAEEKKIRDEKKE